MSKEAKIQVPVMAPEEAVTETYSYCYMRTENPQPGDIGDYQFSRLPIPTRNG